MKYFTTLILIVLTNLSYSQLANFPSAQNPNYWKNKKPYEGYWQQDVHYKINASLDDLNDVITGTLTLIYYNNSPFEINKLYFNLYQNAFKDSSFLSNLTSNNNIIPFHNSINSFGTSIEKLEVNGNNTLFKIFGTIMELQLAQPLAANNNVTIKIDFKTYFSSGNIRRRMQRIDVWGHPHYNGVQWYPKICVFDRKNGWNIDQHLNREFYGDYGIFELNLTLPEDHICEATGTLTNRAEVLPDTLLEKISLKNFKDKPWGEPPSIISYPREGQTKTWKYYAENVHDMAFTTGATYRINTIEKNGVTAVALVQEPHASKWQNASEYALKVIEKFSAQFGQYEYPKIVVADAGDGMEYPMLTLDGGADPTYRELLIHEIAHQWFYGMIGNNETYRPLLDEGFTQFATAQGLIALEGDTEVIRSKSNYIKQNLHRTLYKDKKGITPYLSAAVKNEDGVISTHSDHFNGALGQGGGYRHVYNKTSSMLFNLQYVLGDSLFDAAMKHYVRQWKFCHPYLEDMKTSFSLFAGTDLNWFFDQWLDTDKKLDYKIGRIKKLENNYHAIKFKRKGRMQMPISFSVIDKYGKEQSYYIPNTLFTKKTEDALLPIWYGWDKINPTYTAIIQSEGITEVKIDQSARLADINLVNNSKPKAIALYFDPMLKQPDDRYRYKFYARPDLWYNHYDGLKVGFNLNGNYFEIKHFLDAYLWFNTSIAQSKKIDPTIRTQFDQVSFRLNYSNPIFYDFQNSKWSCGIGMQDGMQFATTAIELGSRNNKHKIILSAKYFERSTSTDLIYPILPELWEAGRRDVTLNIGYEFTINTIHSRGNIKVDLFNTTVGSDYSYGGGNINYTNEYTISKIKLRTRIFLQYATGNNFNTATQLYLAGANPLELMNNKFTRSQGIIPTDWLGFGSGINHFQMGGGLNLRGYAGYLAVDAADDGAQLVYKGTSGGCINAELSLASLFKIKPKLTASWLAFDPYLFGDAGSINIQNQQKNLVLSGLRADAGFGLLATIKKFGKYSKIKPFILRADFPLFLNRPPANEPDFIAFRWIIGIGKAF
ncbi:MAG: hypothetical protein RIQ89_1641 [Bacteroidota bacterium]|jgi:aminopeptidase N